MPRRTSREAALTAIDAPGVPPRPEGCCGGHAFSDPGLLTQALTHRSAGTPHNERLEFLGDALLGAIIAAELHQRWPRADEGALTRARALLVREESLAERARELDLGSHLVMGPGERKTGGHRRDSILSDAFEALIAAIYLDAGFEACRQRVLPWFAAALDALPPPTQVGKDPKTRLQEWMQARQRPLPVYELLEDSGDDHARTFVAACSIAEPALRGEGEGSSRRAAEQAAAQAVLAQLEAGAAPA
jgi:ribonuclease-3